MPGRFISASEAPQQAQSNPLGGAAPGGGSRFISADQAPNGGAPQQQQSFLQQPAELPINPTALGSAGVAGQFGNTVNRFFGGSAGDAASTGLAGLGALTGFGQAANQASQGNFAGASTSGLGGLASLSRVGSSLYAPGSTVGGYLGMTPDAGLSGGFGLAGSALGSVAGLAGAGFAASQGNGAGAVLGGIQGVGSLASLYGSALGASAPALLGATAGPALAGGAAAAGTAATAAAVGAALGVVGGVVAVGAALHPLWEHLDQPSLASRNERRNNAASGALQGHISQGITGAQSTQDLLSIAGISPSIGQGQIQFRHDTAGFGGDYDDPMSPTFAALLRSTSDGNPAALREFISGVHITSGHTGTPKDNVALTDYYRRELAHKAGITDTTGLFQPMDPQNTPGALSQKYLTGGSDQIGGNWESAGTQKTLSDLLGGGLQQVYQPIGPGYGYATVPVSQRFRAAGELQAPAGMRYQLGQQQEKLKRDLALQEQIWRDASSPGSGDGE